MATSHPYTCCPTTLETDFPDPPRRSLKVGRWKVTCKDRLVRYSMGNSLGDLTGMLVSVMDIVARNDTAVSSTLLVLVDAVTFALPFWSLWWQSDHWSTTTTRPLFSFLPPNYLVLQGHMVDERLRLLWLVGQRKSVYFCRVTKISGSVILCVRVAV